MIHPVILAGGSGTRLWPVSRKSYPKQFANLVGGETLFQRTLNRVAGPGFAAPVVITGEDYRFIAQHQTKAVDVTPAELVIEPVPRNTAAAVLTAALLRRDTPDALLLVLPSDHMIADDRAFLKTLSRAAEGAQTGAMVAFGVAPETAAPGLGVFKVSEGQDTLIASEFVENPDAARAQDMVDDDSWLWNAGIFLSRVDAILQAFDKHAPEMRAPVEAALALGAEDLGFHRLAQDAFARCPEVSFEQAILAPLATCRAVRLDCGWSDISNWQALKKGGTADGAQNVTSGNATAINCTGSLLKSDNPDTRLVGLGLKDIVAVATDDGILISDIAHSAEVGTIVQTLRAEGAPQADGFRRCHRPWGYSETLSLGPRFQVRRIMVEPGARLSLQAHVHRAEHWVVVSGSARVTVGDDVHLLTENQSTYIPLGTMHRLENPGKLPLHLIEVQSGCYLGEDDITRYEDLYERTAVA